MLYTVGEEIFNAVTHGVGALLSVAALVIMVVFTSIYGNIWQIVSVSIYGATLVILYSISTIYHSLTHKKAKKVFQILDHSAIYLLIAGTYTPYTLILLRQESIKGWILFGIIWGLTILGIIFTSLFMEKLFKIEVTTFLIMGFSILFALPEMINFFTTNSSIMGLFWLVLGGLLYAVGCIFYKIKKKKYFHSIFHIFVLLGSICHFFSIMFYIL